MAFDFFKSKKDGSGAAPPSGDSGMGNGMFGRDPRKARKFFEYGETMAQARNYDHAIDCYISGLRFDPDNLKRHQELRETALKRKAGGGKPAGMMGVPKVGDSLVDKMLTCEKEWALDPVNAKTLLHAVQAALAAQAKIDEMPPPETTGSPADSALGMTVDTIHLTEIAFWMAELCLEIAATAAKQDKKVYLELVECFRAMHRLDKAIEACNRALKLDSDNSDLVMLAKNLAAEEYNRNNTSTKKGGFRDNLKDAAGQKDIQAELGSSGLGVDELIFKRRNEWMQDQANVELTKKFVDVLLKKEDLATEKEAMAILVKLYEATKEYSHKMKAADIQMQQYGRVATELKRKMEADKSPELAEKYKSVRSKQLKFELEHYAERATQYPTDMKVRFELGKRQYKAQQFDAAIASFQGAKADPKSRPEANFILGQCYGHKGWSDEAIEGFETAMEEHQFEDDRLGKDIRYELMLALARAAKAENSVEKAEKAQKIASSLLQIDINYKDIRDKMETIRSLVKRIKTGG